MSINTRPFGFLDYLPQVFRSGEADGTSLISKFLKPFEVVFEELEAEIEGERLVLTVRSVSGNKIDVESYVTGSAFLPKGSKVELVENEKYITYLSQEIPSSDIAWSAIQVEAGDLAANLRCGDKIIVCTSGIPDLFNILVTPPSQFKYSGSTPFEHLRFLASMIGLPLRENKPVDWNREFFMSAIPLYRDRSTLKGMESLLKEWLKGELLLTRPMLTDLTSNYNECNAVFRLGETATVGVDTVLNEGPPHFFAADLVTDPNTPEMRNIDNITAFYRAARFLLDNEKPAHTFYELRVNAHTMQLAPKEGDCSEDSVYARIGCTSLLWDEPWVYRSY